MLLSVTDVFRGHRACGVLLAIHISRDGTDLSVNCASRQPFWHYSEGRQSCQPQIISRLRDVDFGLAIKMLAETKDASIYPSPQLETTVSYARLVPTEKCD